MSLDPSLTLRRLLAQAYMDAVVLYKPRVEVARLLEVTGGFVVARESLRIEYLGIRRFEHTRRTIVQRHAPPSQHGVVRRIPNESVRERIGRLGWFAGASENTRVDQTVELLLQRRGAELTDGRQLFE